MIFIVYFLTFLPFSSHFFCSTFFLSILLLGPLSLLILHILRFIPLSVDLAVEIRWERHGVDGQGEATNIVTTCYLRFMVQFKRIQTRTLCVIPYRPQPLPFRKRVVLDRAHSQLSEPKPIAPKQHLLTGRLQIQRDFQHNIICLISYKKLRKFLVRK